MSWCARLTQGAEFPRLRLSGQRIHPFIQWGWNEMQAVQQRTNLQSIKIKHWIILTYSLSARMKLKHGAWKRQPTYYTCKYKLFQQTPERVRVCQCFGGSQFQPSHCPTQGLFCQVLSDLLSPWQPWQQRSKSKEWLRINSQQLPHEAGLHPTNLQYLSWLVSLNILVSIYWKQFATCWDRNMC